MPDRPNGSSPEPPETFGLNFARKFGGKFIFYTVTPPTGRPPAADLTGRLPRSSVVVVVVVVIVAGEADPHDTNHRNGGAGRGKTKETNKQRTEEKMLRNGNGKTAEIRRRADKLFARKPEETGAHEFSSTV